MSDLSPNLSLPYLAPAQAQKHVTHNEALGLLDAVVQLAVQSRNETDPPADPAPGARYIVPPGATGAWSGQEGMLALWDGSAWRLLAPAPGWRARLLDEGGEVVWQDDAWQVPVTPLLGVNAAADPVNRLAVAASATLLSHEGDGHRLKINKAQPGDTASLLFQTGWSGRAEMGCAGEEDFSVKVSADGTGWQTALRIARASGRVMLPEGAEVEAPLTGAGVVGTVSQLAGQSTGALLGRGESASGSWLRLADGTQLCWHSVDSSVAGVVSWTFPVAFSSAPVVQAGGMAGSPHLVSAGAVSATGAELSAWDLAGGRAAIGCGLFAAGRWY